ncbi:MAG: hypothetical protein PHU29_04205 [Sulfuricurvum sp.]|uniref:hypothetical protein n=1 Tax=Sulfuricurvum sp. TaxID=2025608 RepID=UPI0026271555|nr:hypothetical protein [Sulfuricurvum sp.]MDD2949968.1 hypothetical protein [Sulfuricurvum sp.]MDD5118143.1 hypothetical protein [Sulfuricurvum sp.]
MLTFKEFLAGEAQKKVLDKINIFEHHVYQNIPGTKNSFREDPTNTSSMTLKHAHVYAKPKGMGKELYSVNINGTGHDGSSGKEIPNSHADYFRDKGYQIKNDNILESLLLNNLEPDEYELFILGE